MTRRAFVGAAAAAATATAQGGRCAMGLSPDCFVIARPSRAPVDYLEYAHARGAGGVQFGLTSFEPGYLDKIRAKAEQLGMYTEVTCMLPKTDDTAQFEQTIKAAKRIGALCLRSVCLSGRRYETFSSMAEWQTFVTDSKARLARTVRVLDREKFSLGLENHKDWTVEEMVPLLRSYSSEYLGTCIDWGNNMSLLDDPYELVEGLAPFAINSHIKDMAVEEYEDGFVMAEVELGKGVLDLKRIKDTILAKRPKVKFSLDMLTRDPLEITCLTGKYWVTYTDRHGKYLANMLRWVRQNKAKQPIPRPTRMSKETALALEQTNVTGSCVYARDVLGLRV
jgi:3-oxoisoapionate decarboxylase